MAFSLPRYKEGSLTLVLNAAERLLQIVLADDSGVLCTQSWAAPMRGTEILVPALTEIFSGLALKPSHVGRIACVRGPGSFTGIRLVLTTAAGLRRGTGALVAGIDFMQSLAAAARRMRPAPCKGQTVWVLTHARRALVHAQAFRAGGDTDIPEAVAPVSLMTPDEAAAAIAESRSCTVIGSGIADLSEEQRAACPEAVFAPAALRDPDDDDLLLLARAAEYAAEDIEPLYVRPCDAVDTLPQQAAKHGIGPEEAAERLEALLHAEPKSLI